METACNKNANRSRSQNLEYNCHSYHKHYSKVKWQLIKTRHDKINSCSAHRTLSIISCEKTSVSAILTSNFICAFFTRAFHTCVVYMPIPLPAQSIWCTLHAVSITCAIRTPKNDHYPQFHYTRIKSPPFVAAGSRWWNSLPVQLRNPDITYGLFRRQLKGFREAWTRRSVTSDMRRLRKKHLLTYLYLIRNVSSRNEPIINLQKVTQVDSTVFLVRFPPPGFVTSRRRLISDICSTHLNNTYRAPPSIVAWNVSRLNVDRRHLNLIWDVRVCVTCVVRAATAACQLAGAERAPCVKSVRN